MKVQSCRTPVCFLLHLQLLLPSVSKPALASWGMRGYRAESCQPRPSETSWPSADLPDMGEPAQICRTAQRSIGSGAKRKVCFCTPLRFCGCFHATTLGNRELYWRGMCHQRYSHLEILGVMGPASSLISLSLSATGSRLGKC